MLASSWQMVARGRVNPLMPGLVILLGVGYAAVGERFIGTGLAVGAVLAYVSGLLLSRRVDLAAVSGNVAGALMVMQVGLLFTMTIVGIAEVILVKIALSMAVASAAGFGITQLAILATFYISHGRHRSMTETSI